MMRSLSWLIIATNALCSAACTGGNAPPDGSSGGDGASCGFDAASIPAYDGGSVEASTTLFAGGQIGSDGRLVFNYRSGDIGVFPFRAMLTGTHESLSALVTPPGRGVAVPPITTTSSNSAVVGVASTTVANSCCGPWADGGTSCTDLPQGTGCESCPGPVTSSTDIGVMAAAPGDATLTIRTNDSAEFDAVNVSVRNAATLRPTTAAGGTVTISSVTVALGQTLRIRTNAFDAAGTQLEARYGITYTSSAPSVCGVREPGFSLDPQYLASANTYDVELKGLARGTATLAIAAAGATAMVNVTVN